MSLNTFSILEFVFLQYSEAIHNTLIIRLYSLTSFLSQKIFLLHHPPRYLLCFDHLLHVCINWFFLFVCVCRRYFLSVSLSELLSGARVLPLLQKELHKLGMWVLH